MFVKLARYIKKLEKGDEMTREEKHLMQSLRQQVMIHALFNSLLLAIKINYTPRQKKAKS